MRVIADLHIHSKYSRATSQKMNINEITRFAEMKGLNLIGTGDFTHPKWLSELKSSLVEDGDTGVYKPVNAPGSAVRFMITGEVSTIFSWEGRTKKVHHLILTPNIETAEQINDRLSRFGDLSADGRPTLEMTAAELVEEVMEVSAMNEVIPAHVWTPWFSVFGAFSGFDSIEDCYEDMSGHIHALETGLSSDPPMNWRLSRLDRYTLVSNSDSHSPYPWRMGREANVFELPRLTYGEVLDAVRRKDPERFLFTIETDPAYGKYHWTGHRKCGVSLPPAEAIKLGNRCPVCGRPLTKGVEQRVEELADRPYGFKPENAIGYRHLLPLPEIIAEAIGASSPAVKEVWGVYAALVGRFGDEYTVLMETPFQELASVVDGRIADAVIRVREGRVKVIPGYDGVYGKLVIFEEAEEAEKRRVGQRSLTEFM